MILRAGGKKEGGKDRLSACPRLSEVRGEEERPMGGKRQDFDQKTGNGEDRSE